MSTKNKEEIEKIHETLRNYSDAYIEADFEKITKSMFEEVRFMRVSPRSEEFDVEYRKFEDWKERIETSKRKNIRFKTSVENIDLTGSTASVRMTWIAEYNSSESYGYTTDYLLLVKLNNKWQIISKLCNSERRRKNNSYFQNECLFSGLSIF